jgi:hypothetical protein
MSLINDALKEAKQAQQESAPSPGTNLQLRPIEPTQPSGSHGGLFWPTALLAAALLLLVLVWRQNHRKDASGPTQVQARTALAAAPTPTPQVAPAAVAPAPLPEPPPAPASAPKATDSSGSGIAVAPLSLDASAATAPQEAVANTSAVAEPPPPKPALPKLQGILFNPTRPCALFSGKTYYVGDKVQGLRLAAIAAESVTLVGDGDTNVLSLAR